MSADEVQKNVLLVFRNSDSEILVVIVIKIEPFVRQAILCDSFYWLKHLKSLLAVNIKVFSLKLRFRENSSQIHLSIAECSIPFR